MTSNDQSPCGRAELVRDYVFDELAAPERRGLEEHLPQCPDCAAELDRLRLTTAALRVLPEQEMPRRIAFVQDRVPASGWLAGFWNSAARLGFASACVLTAGLVYFASHRPAEVHTTVQASAAEAAVSRQEINETVARAVSQAVDRTHAEDLKLTKAALDAVDSKYAQQQRNLMVAMQENLDLQRKHLNTYAVLSSQERMGGGQ